MQFKLHPTRRTVVKVVGGGLASLLVACSPTVQPKTSNAAVQVASVADFPTVGSYLETTLVDVPIVIVRVGASHVRNLELDEVRVVGFSRICSHLGCTITRQTATSYRCECHGSGFDARSGEVTHGPAQVALQQLVLQWRGDDLFALLS